MQQYPRKVFGGVATLDMSGTELASRVPLAKSSSKSREIGVMKLR